MQSLCIGLQIFTHMTVFATQRKAETPYFLVASQLVQQLYYGDFLY